jgi:hypothetical protein
MGLRRMKRDLLEKYFVTLIFSGRNEKDCEEMHSLHDLVSRPLGLFYFREYWLT